MYLITNKLKLTPLGPIPEEWEVFPIYDLAKWINGLAFKNINFSDLGKPVIKINELKHGITDQTRFTQDCFSDDYLLKRGDLLFSWSGSPDTSIDAFWYQLDDGWLNQHIFKIKPNGKVSNKFLYYILKANKPRFIDIAFDKQTTGLGHVTIQDLKRFLVALPALDEQSRIASILSSLDDKIELDRQMNVTLEKIASALFKRWFVDIGDELPEGWRVAAFVDSTEILGGGTPKTTVAGYWDGDIPWFSVVDAPTGRDIFVIDTEKKITKSGVENSAARILKEGTTIISARGTVGKVALIGVPMAINQSCYGLRGKYDKFGYFTYFNTKMLVSVLQNSAHGSVFDTITRETFQKIEHILPPEQVISSFEEVAHPLLSTIKNNLFEIRYLSNVRDSLLPRLMSGRIRV